jgi:Zn-dependent peptidase ImmA (M78 family)/transcriptional regulator with XRE-family HTH domain
MPAVKPEILSWARETAGLSIEEAAQRLGIKDARGVAGADRLRALEEGEEVVGRPTLLKMTKVYRRPLLTFYLSTPPRRGDRGEDYRNLPEQHSDAEALVDALVRDIRARQAMVRAIVEDDEDTERLPFVGSASVNEGIAPVLQSIRRTLGLDLTEFRAQASPEVGFALLREKVEAVGIFVLLAGNLGSHHTALDVDVFRGFALADELAPFIVINDQDARSAWSFTLLHELVHLWLGTTGVSGSFAEARIEKFCNDVASAFLLPENELALVGIDRRTDVATAARLIDHFATARLLSRSMVAYRLLSADIISDPTWRQLRQTFRQLWQESRAAQRQHAREREGGPNYYVVRRHRLGPALLKFVARSISGGMLTPTKASKVLGVKPRSVEPLLSGAALAAGQVS